MATLWPAGSAHRRAAQPRAAPDRVDGKYNRERYAGQRVPPYPGRVAREPVPEAGDEHGDSERGQQRVRQRQSPGRASKARDLRQARGKVGRNVPPLDEMSDNEQAESESDDDVEHQDDRFEDERNDC